MSEDMGINRKIGIEQVTFALVVVPALGYANRQKKINKIAMGSNLKVLSYE